MRNLTYCTMAAILLLIMIGCGSNYSTNTSRPSALPCVEVAPVVQFSAIPLDSSIPPPLSTPPPLPFYVPNSPSPSSSFYAYIFYHINRFIHSASPVLPPCLNASTSLLGPGLFVPSQSQSGVIMVPPPNDDQARRTSLAILKLALKEQEPTIVPNILSAHDLAFASSSITKLRAHTIYKKISGWTMPSSTEPWLPIVVRSGKSLPAPSSSVYVYNFNTNKLKTVDKNIVNATDYDNKNKNYVTDPVIVSAPNFLNAGYIDTNQRLYLLSSNAMNKNLIYEGNKYLRLSINTFSPRNAWSPDSTKLLFSTYKFTGEYDIGNDPIYEENYYKIFNIADGSLTTFPANRGVTVEQFIDNNHVLVHIFVDKKPDSYFITTVLNLDTMQLDQGWFEEKLGSMETFVKKYLPRAGIAGRFFSLQNSKYVYNIREQAREEYTFLPAELFREGRSIFIYGDLQDKTKSTIIASGKWEQYQNPLISPAGDKVAYEEMASPKFTNQAPDPTIFWIYDATTGSQRAYKYENDIKIIKWLTNNKLLFATYSRFSNATLFPDAYNVLDTSTNAVTKVWARSILP